MGRSPCCDKNGLKKGPWTAEEDNKLTQYIQLHGPGNWRSLPKNAGLQRCGKSCRLRWTNYLRPDIKRGRFSFEEEETIIQLHSVLGNKWSAIAARLPGRTDNEIKNFWNTNIRKRLLRNGIDPVTHAPRLDLLDLSSLVNAPQLNLSSLVQLQMLLNPEVLSLALSLGSVNNGENPNILLQKLQGNQLLNSHDQIKVQTPTVIQPNQFENNIMNQGHIPSFQNSSFNSMEGYMSQYNTNSTSSQMSQEQYFPPVTTTSEGHPTSIPNFRYGVSDQTKQDLSDNSTFTSLNSSCSNSNSQNLSFNSALSTPLSSPSPMNGRTEDDNETFFSELLRFEIPEGLAFDIGLM